MEFGNSTRGSQCLQKRFDICWMDLVVGERGNQFKRVERGGFEHSLWSGNLLTGRGGQRGLEVQAVDGKFAYKFHETEGTLSSVSLNAGSANTNCRWRLLLACIVWPFFVSN